VWVDGDRERLHQVGSNLLSNASTHTPAGVSVTTAIRILPDTVRADDYWSHEHSSTGLGLSLVASITEAHRGTVEVMSRPGATRFLIRMPAADQLDAADHEQPELPC
ncbi:ATP-binding protein, partial [Mycolicibacterium sp.]|uniref:ATP-binding protein n=1 Tax=Mycolicibacterium sp. TaxID=2320850 RepID=UPI0025E1827A